MQKRQANQLIFLAAFFIGVLIFYFLPSEIYLGNPTEFDSARSDLVRKLLTIGFVFAACLALPILIPLKAWKSFYASLLGSIFLMCWVSGVFLVGDFGELDGSSFNLGRHASSLIVHSVVSLIVFVGAYIGFTKWPAYLTRAVIVIGIGLLIIGTFNFYQAASTEKPETSTVDVEELARFSTEKNLVIVLMDTFQSDVMQNIIDQDPSIRKELDGFKFFPDTLGVAPTTYLTMPAFHSGQHYNNMMSLSEYYEIGVKKESFLAELSENNYQVDLINPMTSICPTGANICEQQEQLLSHAQQRSDNETFRLADLGIMRVAPGLLKRRVFQDNAGPLTRYQKDLVLSWIGLRVFYSNAILRLIADNLWTDDAPPTVKFIHLFNSHPPYIFDEECNFIGAKNPENRKHMTMQIKCAMRSFMYLLDEMKRQGVYENSMIILTADTGAGSHYAEDDVSSLYARKNGVEAGEFGRLIGGANPVLAIKNPNDKGPLEISATQAQLTDIPRTVCANLNDCTNMNGVDLSLENAATRKRPYNYYRWENKYWGLSHIPGIIHYSVDGPLWNSSSWSRMPSGNMPKVINTVNFSEEDHPDIYGFGWSHYEVNEEGVTKRWSEAKRAELFLPLPMGEDMTLEFKVLVAPGLSGQEMTVRVNGTMLETRTLGNQVQFVSAHVPAELIDKPVSDVVLEFSQLKLSGIPGRRNISVSFYQLKVFQSDSKQTDSGE